MRILLSHPLTADAPGWPGNELFEIEPVRSMGRGDMNNSCILRYHEHFGTHFDAPNHFNAKGPRIAELPFDYFFYDHPLLLDIPKGDDEAYVWDDFAPYESQLSNVDLLLLRSGFCQRFRAADPERYQMHTPFIHPDCAAELVKRFGGTLKTIALDFISLGTPQNRELSCKTHQTLLGCGSQRFICGIEDANLAAIPAGAHLVSAASIPLMTQGTDSGPVTFWVDVETLARDSFRGLRGNGES